MNAMKTGSLLAALPTELPDEFIEVLLSANQVRFERIISKGHYTLENTWYDQELHEFVLVVQGHAHLFLEGHEQPYRLKAGDYVNIPAHCRHRVEWTDPNEYTVWFAVHYI